MVTHVPSMSEITNPFCVGTNSDLWWIGPKVG